MSDFLTSLQEFMDKEEVKALNITSDEGFKINSREQANYFLKQILDLRQQQSEIFATAEEELERLTSIVNQWKEIETAKLDKRIQYFSELLEDFAYRELENTDKHSIKLPYGSIGFKKQQPLYEYDDKSITESLKENFPDLLDEVVQYKFNKSELKKIGTVKDGKLYINNLEIQGVSVTERDDKFDVK